jgi:hypothetical protein
VKKPKQSEPAATMRTTLAKAHAIMDAGIDALAKEVDKLISGKAADSKHDPASRIAYLTKKVAEIADSARKIDAADVKRAAALTRPMVLRWMRGLEPDQRAAIRRELDAMDDEESVLT